MKKVFNINLFYEERGTISFENFKNDTKSTDIDNCNLNIVLDLNNFLENNVLDSRDIINECCISIDQLNIEKRCILVNIFFDAPWQTIPRNLIELEIRHIDNVKVFANIEPKTVCEKIEYNDWEEYFQPRRWPFYPTNLIAENEYRNADIRIFNWFSVIKDVILSYASEPGHKMNLFMIDDTIRDFIPECAFDEFCNYDIRRIEGYQSLDCMKKTYKKDLEIDNIFYITDSASEIIENGDFLDLAAVAADYGLKNKIKVIALHYDLLRDVYFMFEWKKNTNDFIADHSQRAKEIYEIINHFEWFIPDYSKDNIEQSTPFGNTEFSKDDFIPKIVNYVPTRWQCIKYGIENEFEYDY